MAPLYLLDTNIIMRSLIKENQTMYQACTQLLSFLKKGRLRAYIPSIVLAETAWNLKSPYHFTHQTIAKVIASTLNTKGLMVIDDINLNNASKLFSQLNIKFANCLIASSQKLLSGQTILISYDHDFDKIKTINRLEPQDVLGQIQQ